MNFELLLVGCSTSLGGSNRDVVEFEHKKIARRTFLITLPSSLKNGEYGLLTTRRRRIQISLVTREDILLQNPGLIRTAPPWASHADRR